MVRERRKKGGGETPEKAPEPVVQRDFVARRRFLLGALGLVGAGMAGKAAYEQAVNVELLQQKGDLRSVIDEVVEGKRGLILDRNGEPLAVSAPVQSLFADGRRVPDDQGMLEGLARLLDMPYPSLRGLLEGRRNAAFIWVKRWLDPQTAQKVEAYLRRQVVPGFEFRTEYLRYYPGGEMFAHVVGFTGVDNFAKVVERGEGKVEVIGAGMELVANERLEGKPGRRRVVRDGKRNPVGMESLEEAVEGEDITLSIDSKLQFFTFAEMKQAVAEYGAKGATAVILDAKTGEVLAMVNLPSFNPNETGKKWGPGYSNLAITAQFEPGSTMKPFTVALGLELGNIRPESTIDCQGGRFSVGRNVVTDVHRYGVLDITRVIQKSSNVAVAKIALGIDPPKMHAYLKSLGFGASTETGFPGEEKGVLQPARRWARITQANIAYGYGIAVNALQLAQAYTIFTADGKLLPVTLLRREGPPEGRQVIRPEVSRTLRAMMETVTQKGGTATRAAIPNYRVAGKTGTVEKLVNGRYSGSVHQALFAGMAPVSDPRLIMVIMVDEPTTAHFGGLVAAPLFARVMEGALRLLNVPPDGLDPKATRLASKGKED